MLQPVPSLVGMPIQQIAAGRDHSMVSARNSNKSLCFDNGLCILVVWFFYFFRSGVVT